jgi:hypothetical protein
VIRAFARRRDGLCPRPNLQRGVEVSVSGARDLGSFATQPTICGESGAEHRAGNGERGQHGEADEHEENADANDANGDCNRREAILDRE